MTDKKDKDKKGGQFALLGGETREQANAGQLKGMKKFFERAGVSASGLLTQAASKENGTLGWKDYGIFWLLFQQLPDEATQALATLLKLLSTAVGSSDQKTGVTVDNLVNTISFCTLYCTRIKLSDTSIVNYCKGWTEKAAWPQSNDVIRRLALFSEKQDQQDAIIGALIIGLSTLHSVKEFQKLAEQPTFDDEDVGAGEAAFLYEYMRRFATEEGKLVPVLSDALTKCMTLGSHLKMAPKIAETTLLALLFVMRNFLTIAPISDLAFIKRAITTIQPFWLWPVPFAPVARECLQLLRMEALAPGACMRARLNEDAWSANYQEDPRDEKKSAVYYFMDKECKVSQAFAQMVDLESYKHEKKRPVPKWKLELKGTYCPLSAQQQALCVLNAMHIDGGVGTDDLTNMQGCTNDDVYKLYQKLTQIFSSVSKDPDAAVNERKKMLAGLRTEMKQLAAASKGKPGVKLPESLAAPYLPRQPVTIHYQVGCDGGKFMYTPPTSRHDMQVMCLKYFPYQDTSPKNELAELLKRFVQTATRDAAQTVTTGEVKTVEGEGRVHIIGGNGAGNGDQEVKIIIAGGDQLLHAFVSAYVSLLQEPPQTYFAGLKLRFYLIPTMENHLAAFFARNDSWYNRHIFVPFRCGAFMVPWVKTADDPNKTATDSKDWNRPSVEPPGVWFRSQMESYIREANITNQINVYKIQGWSTEANKGKAPPPATTVEVKLGDVRDDKPKNPCDQLIPWIQQVELGQAAAVQVWREKFEAKGPVGAPKTADDVMKEKTFEFTPPELTVKYAKMDLAGQKTPVLIDEPMAYGQILVANVPRKDHQCFPPDPTAGHLEMFAKSFRGAVPKKKNPLFSDPKQHIYAVTIECAQKNASFHLLVDGCKLFGPFNKVKISPVKEHGTGKPFSMPFTTFFPLDQ